MAEQKVETVDIKVIETKLDKKEPLTKAEENFLLQSQPAPEEFGGNPAPGTEAPEEGEEGKKETPVEKAPEEKKAQEKSDADKKASEALAARAKAAGLSEKATETEIQVAEQKREREADEKDPLFKIERSLQENQDKADDQVDISKADFTPREKAYFWQMRRDRKAKQQAEADRDAAKFELSKVKKEKPAEKPAEEEDPFKGKEDGDFLTIADVKKILAQGQKPKEEIKMDFGSFLALPAVQNFLKGCDVIAAQEHKDYAEVMELTEEIINVNPDYQKKVADAFSKGDNPALKIYELIKGDAAFSKLLPAAQTRVAARKTKKTEEASKDEPKAKSAEELKKEADAKRAEEALENNDKKPKTSGHAEGKDKIEGSDLTIEQIAAMSDREFAKLPKKTREKYLEMYG